MNIKKHVRCGITVFCCCTVISCMSVPTDADVPENALPVDLIQMAQEAFDANNYRGAEGYYRIILSRFASDQAVCIAAEYEIAHIYIKKHQWQQAHNLLKHIIEKYNGITAMNLPPQYYKLAQIDYEKTLKKISKNNS